ncbi:MAG: hypothetical protein WAQ33_14090 [Gaiellaceae bacterium]
MSERDPPHAPVARVLDLLREELAELLVEAAQQAGVQRDPDQRRRHALRHRERVEARRPRRAAVVALEDQAAVALDEHAEHARLGAQLAVERGGVKALACMRSGNGEQQPARRG